MPNKNSKSEVGCFEEKLGLHICIGGGTRVGGKKKKSKPRKPSVKNVPPAVKTNIKDIKKRSLKHFYVQNLAE